MSDTYRPLIAIVGPTAAGKTSLAVRLAEHLAMEVISADSRQVYRYMDIGTAKPTAEEQRRVRHHLIDIRDPDDPFTLAEYQELAYQSIQEVHERGAVPFLVGGTGLYVRAVLEGFQIPHVPPDPDLRARLEEHAATHGCEALHRQLAEIDPVAAERIDARNVRRVARALEVCYLTGQPISQLQEAQPPPYRVLQIGVNMPRPVLYERIDRRIEQMLAAGLVEEVRGLVARGYGYELRSMSGLGYREIGDYLRGEASLDEAITLLKRNTRRLVRQQANWFRADDPAITWFDLSVADVGAVRDTIRAFLQGA